MIYKSKSGQRTQKSAADNPKILAGCFFNPQNVYFEVCMVRAKVVCFMNNANPYTQVGEGSIVDFLKVVSVALPCFRVYGPDQYPRITTNWKYMWSSSGTEKGVIHRIIVQLNSYKRYLKCTLIQWKLSIYNQCTQVAEVPFSKSLVL